MMLKVCVMTQHSGRLPAISYKVVAAENSFGKVLLVPMFPEKSETKIISTDIKLITKKHLITRENMIKNSQFQALPVE